jgi:hypothetical protein
LNNGSNKNKQGYEICKKEILMHKDEIKKRIHENLEISRLNEQYETLKKLDKGLLKGIECIETIVGLQNLIRINTDLIKEMNSSNKN